MDLKAKLARLTSPAGWKPRPAAPAAAPPPEDASRAERVAWLRARLETMSARSARPKVRVRPRQQAAKPIGLPGRRCDTEHGPVHAVVQCFSPGHRHGEAPVSGGLQANALALAQLALDPSLQAVDPSRLLFFDTETTGLSGGTGILPFLIGVAWFDNGTLWLEQLLLTRLADEPAMLRWLGERIATASGLVSYNGKAFDWPLIRNRFIMTRVAMPAPPPHLDLLHCARRAFKHRLDSCRLTEVEAELLGFHRTDDVDGADIPSLYWDYLRSGDGSILEPIVEHNANDVVALAALTGVLSRGFAGAGTDADPRISLGYAQHAARIKDTGRAARFARAAADAGDTVAADALQLLATVERRRGDPSAAARALEEALAATPPAAAAQIHLGLAKLYEHRLRDPERALRHAREVGRAEGLYGQAKRIARLEKRIERRRSAAVREGGARGRQQRRGSESSADSRRDGPAGGAV
jgi:uncharacterized protein YprB with RNaseH-like and TPR domain